MILETKELKKSYSGKSIVNGLSFNVAPGEIVGLLGPNGAGKTTAFYMTMGLIRPDSGQVFFGGEDITKLPVHKRAKLGMGYLAQEPSIFRNLTVEQNILCILETLPISKKEQKNRLDALLHELNLTQMAKKRASTLSGGERRRLEIARTLVTNPTLLLLDEPFANIDPITVFDVKQMIRHLKSLNISVLITDHNAREISSIVDRAYLIQKGSVSLSGTVAELLDNEHARSSYFGEDFDLP
ncbi:MAG: Lipopolysaccharide export system ATP-binding protein LptB [Chlamydiia bacterium]|nr:Lipopolysaccharide export system ATP-binding protein LptB [Chlamydiia bacterium]MCH9616687.1 Lipopolysaccharide export system ATP-binding protein LptB [Chlamydiia bacterium]MCH9629418.1 Lipopolysaccharide export system ATP-binding protein LptB [Chlamydiia bacterium]